MLNKKFIYLDEKVYITRSPEFPHRPNYVCRLNSSLYDLRQTSRCCFEKFVIILTSLAFCASRHDYTLFVHYTSVGIISLTLYVDDMSITSDDCVVIESLKYALARYFAMKDKILLRYFLGLELLFYHKDYLLSRSKYFVDYMSVPVLLVTRLLILLLRCMFDISHLMFFL